eukprot:CAMPEP_0174386140 /NCGR_PEP_ID=MMETSP0811_2-20130205/127077_1 /TAXON_ID=73025 ORGANISM="Eutreptiella gymnastica-like, Strain CCMP1594" /NCGR_SAMPLE_ID=MMETSP0811_2 /ASSEMBLY_ACC=CAM_ASM_000667 /LENGTH=79 /DNA_ID=CAMNT_0015540711 /DNA_START=400 /DNA_END=639 /DNA_ORIENTATION=+
MNTGDSDPVEADVGSASALTHCPGSSPENPPQEWSEKGRFDGLRMGAQQQEPGFATHRRERARGAWASVSANACEPPSA